MKPGEQTTEYKIVRCVLLAIPVLETLISVGVFPAESRWAYGAGVLLSVLYQINRTVLKLWSGEQSPVKTETEDLDADKGSNSEIGGGL